MGVSFTGPERAVVDRTYPRLPDLGGAARDDTAVLLEVGPDSRADASPSEIESL